MFVSTIIVKCRISFSCFTVERGVHPDVGSPAPPLLFPLPLPPRPLETNKKRLLKDIGLFDSAGSSSATLGGETRAAPPSPLGNATSKTLSGEREEGEDARARGLAHRSPGVGNGYGGAAANGVNRVDGLSSLSTAAASSSSGYLGAPLMPASPPPPPLPSSLRGSSTSTTTSTKTVLSAVEKRQQQQQQAAGTLSSSLSTPLSYSSSSAAAATIYDPAIMAYLTELLAFPKADAERALSNTSGTDLAEALDYLCLHTDEAGLKKGFRRGVGSGRGRGEGIGARGGKGGGKAAGGGGGGGKILGTAPGSSSIEVRH